MEVAEYFELKYIHTHAHTHNKTCGSENFKMVNCILYEFHLNSGGKAKKKNQRKEVKPMLRYFLTSNALWVGMGEEWRERRAKNLRTKSVSHKSRKRTAN